jgi:hypothetical protein
LAKELDVAKGRLKAAERDAVGWNVKYEGLKNSSEGTLGEGV